MESDRVHLSLTSSWILAFRAYRVVVFVIGVDGLPEWMDVTAVDDSEEMPWRKETEEERRPRRWTTRTHDWDVQAD